MRLITIFTTFLVGALIIVADQEAGSILEKNLVAAPSQNQIPEATNPHSPDEGQWWRLVRAAGKEAATATKRKEKAILDAINRFLAKRKSPPADERDLMPEREVKKLNDPLQSAKEKYTGLLRRGAEKSYRVPIADSRPLVLQPANPRFTEDARQQRIVGVVLASAQFLADGTVGEVKIRQRLGHGLDETAVEAVRRIVFLPAIKDGKFVEFSQSIAVEFNIQ
jgi:TonB family protein